MSAPGLAQQVVAAARAAAAGTARTRSRWPLVVALSGLAVAAAVAVIVASVGGSGSGGGKAFPLQAVATYDPAPGDGHEHDEQIALAIDGDPATAWSTERYGAALDVIGKPGIGLVLDAGRAEALRRVAVVTDTPGFTAEILAGDAPGGPFTAAAPSRIVAARSVFTVAAGVSKRYWVVWLTKLAGDQAHLNEVSAG